MSSWMIPLGLCWLLLQFLLLVRCKPPIGTMDNFYQKLISSSGAVQVGMFGWIFLVIGQMFSSPNSWPLWWVTSTSYVLLVWIDLRTSYLPKLVQSWCISQLLLAILICKHLLGLGVSNVTRALLGSAIVTLFYLVIWHFAAGALGFGDVILAGSVSLVSGSHSWGMLWQSLSWSALIGAVWALLSMKIKNPTRSNNFPYGPAILMGQYAALIAVSITGY